ncbi:MAG: cell envelope integrity protein TolA [Pseudomonadota bacterium]
MRVWWEKSIAFVGAVLLHVVIVALLFSNISWQAPQKQRPATTIKATVIDASAFELADAVLSERTIQAPPEPPPQPAPQPQVDEAKAQREREAALQEQREQAQREAAEQQRIADERRAVEEAAAEQAAADKAAADKAERERAAAQRERDAEVAAEKERQRQAAAEAERKRKAAAEAERKREAAARAERERKEAAAQAARREAERQAELDAQLRDAMEAEEARQGAINSGLLAQYVEVIRQKVERNWSRPPGVADGITCEIRVRQLRSGEVVSVQVVNCAGGEVLIRSIETAVRKASPLPKPRDPSLFDANLRFPFKTGE